MFTHAYQVLSDTPFTIDEDAIVDDDGIGLMGSERHKELSLDNPGMLLIDERQPTRCPMLTFNAKPAKGTSFEDTYFILEWAHASFEFRLVSNHMQAYWKTLPARDLLRESRYESLWKSPLIFYGVSGIIDLSDVVLWYYNENYK